jgi:hypothetical protein
MTMGSCCDVISDETKDRAEKREKGKVEVEEEEEERQNRGEDGYHRRAYEVQKCPSICLTN